MARRSAQGTPAPISLFLDGHPGSGRDPGPLGRSVFRSTNQPPESRNQQIQVEINRLEQRIARIRELEITRNRLLSRKQIIESLQASRSLTVELLDKLAKTIPVGITLTNVRQQGKRLTLLGSSQSNARVSAYLQSLEGMDLFVRPELQYVRAASQPASRVETYEFAITVTLNNKRDDPEAAGEQPAGAG